MPQRNQRPICTDPGHFYDAQGRRTTGRVLETWLVAQLATPFELIHRRDLAEKLLDAGSALQHAVQKAAVPAAQAQNRSVHEVIRDLHQVIDRAMARLREDDKQGRFPGIERGGFADACRELVEAPEGAYLLGGAVALRLADAEGWEAKIEGLLDLLAEAPDEPPAREFALSILEQPIGEMLGFDGCLEGLVGHKLDRGALIMAMACLAHGQAVEAVVKLYPPLARYKPQLPEAALALSRRLDRGEFSAARADMDRRILKHLTAPGRLHPDSVTEEIRFTRVLTAILTAAAGDSLPPDEVRAALVARAKRLVETNFLSVLLAGVTSPLAETSALVLVLENVTGDDNRQRALRLVETVATSSRLAAEMMDYDDGPENAISNLARLNQRIARAGVGVEGLERSLQAIAGIAGRIRKKPRVKSMLANEQALAARAS